MKDDENAPFHKRFDLIMVMLHGFPFDLRVRALVGTKYNVVVTEGWKWPPVLLRVTQEFDVLPDSTVFASTSPIQIKVSLALKL